MAIAAVGAIASCADCFYAISGHVVECGTTVPVSGATITVRIDDGLHNGVYAKTFTTTDTGDFVVTNDATEVCGTAQTLTFTKNGFAPLSTQVTGAADAPPIDLCMARASGP
jgi:hypothetical protein